MARPCFGSSFSRHVAAASLWLLPMLDCAAYGARPASPIEGGRPWVEVTSEHFRVVSDLPAEQANSVAHELEQSFDALDQAIFAHPRAPTEPTMVVLFQDESDFHAFAPRLSAGVFYDGLPNDLESSRCILLHGELSPLSRVALLHELTHDFVDRNFGVAPLWLNEGLAEYYSTVVVESGRVIVGRALPHVTFTGDGGSFSGKAADGSWVTALSVQDLVLPHALLALDRAGWRRVTHVQNPEPEDRLRGAALYVGAWAFVHMLQDGPYPYPARYRRFLDAAQSSRVEDAFHAAFSDITPARFDDDFRSYVLSRQVVVSSIAYRPTASAQRIAHRLLADAEVHLLWARLSPWDGANLQLARADLDRALAESPTLAEARYFRGLLALKEGAFDKAEVELSMADRLVPGDGRFLLALVSLRLEQLRRDRSLSRTQSLAAAVDRLAVSARSATELRIAAEFYMERGQADRARELAEGAVARSPLDSSALDTYAAILDALGQFDEAIAAQRKAIAFVGEGSEAMPLLAHLLAYEGHKAPRSH